MAFFGKTRTWIAGVGEFITGFVALTSAFCIIGIAFDNLPKVVDTRPRQVIKIIVSGPSDTTVLGITDSGYLELLPPGDIRKSVSDRKASYAKR